MTRSLLQSPVYVFKEISVTGAKLNLEFQKISWFFEGIELIGKMLLLAAWQFTPCPGHCAQGSGALPLFKEWGQTAALGANNLLSLLEDLLGSQACTDLNWLN